MIQNLCTDLTNLLPKDIETNSDALNYWINEQASDRQLRYLLAHAEDGVIWGRFDKGRLLTSGEVFDQLPVLRSLTLQQCRIFGETGEVLLWKANQGWRSRLCQEDNNPEIDFIEEKQLLWGTKKVTSERDGFTLLADGSQGLRHAVPLVSKVFSEENILRPVRLGVRHYVDYDEDGLAYICLSRLVDLFIKDSGETKDNAA